MASFLEVMPCLTRLALYRVGGAETLGPRTLGERYSTARHQEDHGPTQLAAAARSEKRWQKKSADKRGTALQPTIPPI
jgi:hypothetical protein